MKRLILFCILSSVGLTLSACKDVTQVVSSALNIAQCDSETSVTMYRDMFHKGLVSELTTGSGAIDERAAKLWADKISVKLQGIRTTRSDKDSSKKFCEATGEFTLSSNLLSQAELSRAHMAEIQSMTDNTVDGMYEKSVQDVLKSHGFSVDGNRVTKTVAYAIQPTDDGKQQYMEQENQSESKLAFILLLNAKANEIEGLLSATKQAIVQQAKAELQQTLESKSISVIENSGNQILNSAYELAFGNLKYQSAELLGSTESSTGYEVKVKLNYLNLFDAPHYLIVAFNYDVNGNLIANQIAGYSDSIAPNSLTFNSLIQSLQK